jgi:hypothetical protein
VLTNMSLESERSIKAWGKFKWCLAAVQCDTTSDQSGIRNSSVRRISIKESHKLLAHLISPKDSSRTQTTQIQEICNKFNWILQQDILNTNEYEALYKSVFTSTIKYILQGSSLKQTEINKVSKLTKHLFLHRMRYS